MKNLITSMACIAILLAFVLQFAQNQVIYNHITSIDQQVNSFKEMAKQDGYIAADNINRLKAGISPQIGCSAEKIKVTGTQTPVKRGQLIAYKVSVPIEGIISANGFWGINEEENMTQYTIERYTTSEYIGR